MQKIMLVDHRHSDSLLFILWVLCGSNMVKSFKIITAEPFFFPLSKTQGKHSRENLSWETNEQPTEGRH